MHTINLEAGFPSVDDARRRLAAGMDSARRGGKRLIKIVHGRGSSGEGGKLGPAIRNSPRLRADRDCSRPIPASPLSNLHDCLTQPVQLRKPHL